MKTLVISVLIGLTSLMLSGQNITHLDEAQLIYSPFKNMTQQGDSYIYVVKDVVSQSFAQDPIGFMKANFNIHKFIELVADESFDSYEVTFTSSNGQLIADFDREGELRQTREHFKNVILPDDLRQEIYQNYKGWTIVDTKYDARTNGEIVASATYKVRLENGSDKEKLKIDAKERGITVAVEY